MGYSMTCRVAEPHSHTTEELQRAIRDEIATVNQELLCQSAVSFVHR